MMMQDLSKNGLGYAYLSNLLKGWSNDHSCVKLQINNLVESYLSMMYSRFSRCFHEANYYAISTSIYYCKWSPVKIDNHNNPIQNICIVELNEKPDDEVFPGNGIEIIGGAVWYIIYIRSEDKGILTTERFRNLLDYLLDCILDIMSYDAMNRYSETFWSHGSYNVYKFIFPIYCVFEWLYSLDSNTSFDMWEPIIYNKIIDRYYSSRYVYHDEYILNVYDEYEEKIIAIVYDLLLYMSKAKFIYMEDICSAIMNSDLIRIFADFDTIRSVCRTEDDFNKQYNARKDREIHFKILKEMPVSNRECKKDGDDENESDRADTDTEV